MAEFVGLLPGLQSLSRDDWIIFLCSFLVYTLTYFGLRRFTKGYGSAKPCDGWIPSLVCSSVVTILSLPTLVEAAQHGFTESWYSTESLVSRVALLHFFAFLVFELTVGAVFYPKQLDMLSGWVHHIIYLWITVEGFGHRASNLLGAWLPWICTIAACELCLNARAIQYQSMSAVAGCDTDLTRSAIVWIV